jgi:protoheme IX farnesyltransferase
MTAIAGFFFASQGNFDWQIFAGLVLGVALIIASGCVFNNYLDRGIDQKMARTKNRALVTGDISVRAALLYATILGILGFSILALYTNYLTVLVGVIGIIDYVVLYGYAKRHSVHSTLIGGISGSTSLVAGYVAVTGSFDIVALLLFLIMAFWQMPHFYAIGVYRKKDYAAADLPILPVKTGIAATKKQTLFYIVGYIITASLLSILGYTGYVYFITMLGLGIWWLYVALQGFKPKTDDIKWGHRVFGISLLILMAFSVLISLDWLLP